MIIGRPMPEDLSEPKTFCVSEWYVDAFCPSGDNDYVVRFENIRAHSEREAERIYRLRHDVHVNNELRTTLRW